MSNPAAAGFFTYKTARKPYGNDAAGMAGVGWKFNRWTPPTELPVSQAFAALLFHLGRLRRNRLAIAATLLENFDSAAGGDGHEAHSGVEIGRNHLWCRPGTRSHRKARLRGIVARS